MRESGRVSPTAFLTHAHSVSFPFHHRYIMDLEISLDHFLSHLHTEISRQATFSFQNPSNSVESRHSCRSMSPSGGQIIEMRGRLRHLSRLSSPLSLQVVIACTDERGREDEADSLIERQAGRYSNVRRPLNRSQPDLPPLHHESRWTKHTHLSFPDSRLRCIFKVAVVSSKERKLERHSPSDVKCIAKFWSSIMFSFRQPPPIPPPPPIPSPLPPPSLKISCEMRSQAFRSPFLLC